MFCTRFALAAVFLYTLVLSVFAAPANVTLERRISHEGRGTWFEVGLGYCGWTDTDSYPTVAISIQRYNAVPEGEKDNCGQWIHITNKANGKSAFGQTRDACMSCDSNGLDMSPSLFGQLSDLGVGVLDIEWNFMPVGYKPHGY